MREIHLRTIPGFAREHPVRSVVSFDRGHPFPFTDGNYIQHYWDGGGWNFRVSPSGYLDNYFNVLVLFESGEWGMVPARHARAALADLGYESLDL